jgi:hypothetical protein
MRGSERLWHDFAWTPETGPTPERRDMPPERETASRPRKRGENVATLFSMVVPAALVSLLVLTSPFASAAPMVKLHPPFTGATPFAYYGGTPTGSPKWCPEFSPISKPTNRSTTLVLVPPAAHAGSGRVVASSEGCAGAMWPSGKIGRTTDSANIYTR